jgi:hypothetical protein
LVCSALAGLTPVYGIAADWSLNTYAVATAEYNDNKRLVLEEHETATGGIVDVGLGLGRQTETNKFVIKPRLRSSRYDGEEGLDSDDQYVESLYEHYTERSEYTFNIDYTRDSPLTSEFQDVEFVQVNKRRETWRTNPVWAYQVTERLSTNLGAGYTDVTNEDSERTGLIDYTYTSAFAGMSYAASEYTQIGMTLYGSRLQAPATQNETDDTGIRLSLWYSVFESLSFHAKFSWHKSTVKIGHGGDIFTDTRRGRLLDLEVVKKFENGRISLSARNEIEPGSLGTLEQRDRYMADLSYRLTGRTNAGFQLRNTIISDATDNAAFEEWEYRQVICELVYRTAPNVYLSGAYRYSWKKYEILDNEAESSAVLLSLRYQNL